MDGEREREAWVSEWGERGREAWVSESSKDMLAVKQSKKTSTYRSTPGALNNKSAQIGLQLTKPCLQPHSVPSG